MRGHRSEFRPGKLFAAWGKILSGRLPMLSIEITRECPLRCPGCYAYGDMHLGGDTTLRQLSDLRGQALLDGVLELVRKHRPLQVSLVGGEPLVRHRELNQILPRLSQMGVFTMVVTSAVIPIPKEWMEVPRLIVAVSVDGLPEHHDERRKPSTLRTHSEEHGRSPPEYSLDCHSAYAGARGIHRGVRRVFERAARGGSHLGEPVQPAG